MSVSIDPIDFTIDIVKNLNHPIMKMPLIDKAHPDLLVEDVIFCPSGSTLGEKSGVTGAFFYQLNKLCYELYHDFPYFPVAITPNKMAYDYLNASLYQVDGQRVYGASSLSKAQAHTLIRATLESLFKPVTDDNGAVKGAKYMDCLVLVDENNIIQPLKPSAAMANGFLRNHGLQHNLFVPAKKLVN